MTPAEVQELVAWFEGGGVEPRVEFAPAADGSLLEALGGAGFRVRDFENVLFRELGAADAAPPHGWPAGVTLRLVDPSDAADVRRYARTVLAGFMPPGMEPPDEFLALSERVVRQPRSRALVAEVDGVAVGGGGMEAAGDLAALFGASVAPTFRRRGVQGALIAARLNLAAKQGAALATIGTRPGIPTERNARRLGFQLAYTKIVLVRPGPGLAPVLT